MLKHGLTCRKGDVINKRFYNRWYMIQDRCNNSENKFYKNYGGRGIKCEWCTIESFKKDMYESYIEHIKIYGEKNTTIDRIDNNGNYCKDNCRRATQNEQSYNKTNTIYITINGKKYNSDEYAKEFGVSKEVASSRISHYLKGKLTIDTLLLHGNTNQKHKSDISSKHKITIGDKTYTIRDIANITGLKLEGASRRYSLYKEGKISAGELLLKGKRQTSKATVYCVIDGITYTKKTLSELIGCSETTARNKIKKYNKGLIEKDELLNNKK